MTRYENARALAKRQAGRGLAGIVSVGLGTRSEISQLGGEIRRLAGN